MDFDSAHAELIAPGRSARHGEAMRRRRREPRIGLLRSAPAFRNLWLSRSVSFTGDGVARVALVLVVAHRGPNAVALVLLVNTAPRLLGPLAGAVTDRVDQRRLLAGAEIGQGAIYALLAIISLPLAGLLPVVAAAGLLATLVSPAGKSSVARLVPADQLPAANALLGTAFNLQVLVGPAIGGVLAGVAGTSIAFAVNAASFGISAALLRRLPPLPPEVVSPTTVKGLASETMAGLRYAARTPIPRALVAGTLLFVSFAALDNVALVFLVERSLHGSRVEYGLAVAAFGVGMVIASVTLVRIARRRSPRYWLVIGITSGAVGTAATGVSPMLGLAVIGQAVAGAGNSLDLVANDTLVQQLVPRHLLGRVFGTVNTAAQAGSALAYVAAGPLIAATGPRTTLVVSSVGMMLGLAALWPVWRPSRG
jgi:MFS family permease